MGSSAGILVCVMVRLPAARETLGFAQSRQQLLRLGTTWQGHPQLRLQLDVADGSVSSGGSISLTNSGLQITSQQVKGPADEN